MTLVSDRIVLQGTRALSIHPTPRVHYTSVLCFKNVWYHAKATCASPQEKYKTLVDSARDPHHKFKILTSSKPISSFSITKKKTVIVNVRIVKYPYIYLFIRIYTLSLYTMFFSSVFPIHHRVQDTAVGIQPVCLSERLSFLHSPLCHPLPLHSVLYVALHQLLYFLLLPV